MKELTCEDFLMNKMALLDGERAELSEDAIAAHFAACENCAGEIEGLQTAARALGRYERRRKIGRRHLERRRHRRSRYRRG